VQLLWLPARGANRPAVDHGERPVEMGKRVRRRDFGQRRRGGHHFRQRRQPRKITCDESQHHPLAQTAQTAGESCFVCGRRARQHVAHFAGTERAIAPAIQVQFGLGIE
jgi:hypothetical protein